MRGMTKADLSFQYFPFYVTRYLEDVEITALSLVAEACYIRLCARQWKAVTLPLDPTVLWRLTKASPSEWRKAWKELEPLFPVTEDGSGRRNPALDALREERAQYIETRRVNGRSGGRPPKHHETTEKTTAHPKAKQEQSKEKPHGFPLGAGLDNQRESLGSRLRVERPHSPPPDGGGPPPAPFDRSLDLVQAELKAALSEAVATIPTAECQTLVARLLDEQRIEPARWFGWVKRIEGWAKGMGTTGMAPVSWDAIAQGLDELLLTNPPGQRITPKILLIFVEDAHRRLSSGAPRASAQSMSEDETAKKFARAGDPDAIAWCTARGIDYREAVA